MPLSDTQLDEFIALYKAEFGVEPEREDAREVGIFIMQLVKAVEVDSVRASGGIIDGK